MVEIQTGGMSQSCVDSVTLAAFLEGTLGPDARQRVLAHVASCPDCSELVAEIVRTDDELRESSPGPSAIRVEDAAVELPPRPLVWRRRGALAAVGGLALAASLLLMVFNRGSALDPVVAAVGDERLTLARPTGGFHYGPLRSPVRGAAETDNLQLLAEAARLRDRADRTKAPADLHAAGVAQLVAGDVAVSIGSLEAAAQASPNQASFHADLGAAYMTRFLDQGDQADGTRALDALNTALSLSPALAEAWFNKGVLLQRMDRPADAQAAWTKYLELPAEQGWRDEAIRQRDALKQ